MIIKALKCSSSTKSRPNLHYISCFKCNNYLILVSLVYSSAYQSKYQLASTIRFSSSSLNSIRDDRLSHLHYTGEKEREKEEKKKRKKGEMAEKIIEKGGGLVLEKAENDHDEMSGKITSMRTAETLFRLLPMGLCVAALTVMLKNSQSNDFGSLSYSHLGAFKYLVHANGICAGYSLLSAVVTAVPRPSTMCRAWTFFFLDQLLTYIILAAGAVSTEVMYLAYKGDQAITWSAACGTFGGFCHKATASVAITFVVMLCYAALSLVSSYRLFSRFDPPSTHPACTKGSDMAAFHT